LHIQEVTEANAMETAKEATVEDAEVADLVVNDEVMRLLLLIPCLISRFEPQY